MSSPNKVQLPEDKLVDCCLCYNQIKAKNVFLSITIFDLIMNIISLGTTANPISLIISIIWTIINVICLIIYIANGNYGTGLHYFYAICRLITYYIFIGIIIVAFLVLIVFSIYDSAGRLLYLGILTLCAILFLPYGIFSLYWSQILINATQEKRNHVKELENNENNEIDDIVLAKEPLNDQPEITANPL